MKTTVLYAHASFASHGLAFARQPFCMLGSTTARGRAFAYTISFRLSCITLRCSIRGGCWWQTFTRLCKYMQYGVCMVGQTFYLSLYPRHPRIISIWITVSIQVNIYPISAMSNLDIDRFPVTILRASRTVYCENGVTTDNVSWLWP